MKLINWMLSTSGQRVAFVINMSLAAYATIMFVLDRLEARTFYICLICVAVGIIVAGFNMVADDKSSQ